MIAVAPVLRAVEHLKKRRNSRLAPVVFRKLVNLIQQNQRVLAARAPESLRNPPRHRTDIGSAVAAEFGFVLNAAETDAHITPSECARDALGNRCFARSGRPHEAEYILRSRRVQFPHGEAVQYLLFDILKTVMIPFEHTLCRGEIRRILRDAVKR